MQRIHAEQALIEERLDEADGVGNIQRQLDHTHLALPGDGNMPMDVDGLDSSLPVPPHLRHIEMATSSQPEPPLARAIAAKRRAVDHVVRVSETETCICLFINLRAGIGHDPGPPESHNAKFTRSNRH